MVCMKVLFNETKTIVCVFISLLAGLYGLSQTTIDLQSVSKHIGDSVKVCGKIYGGRYISGDEGSPTIINMGGLYPHAPLTLVVWGYSKRSFDGLPEIKYKDKNVCATGKITSYKGRPAMILYEEDQLQLSSN